MSTVTLPAPAEVTLPDPESPVLVAGAGGFIGGHLVADLRQRGHRAIRAVDHKPLGVWHHLDLEADNRVLDLSRPEACAEATDGVRWVYDLAADTGGMGFIESNRARCMLSVLIGTNLLVSAEAAGVERFFFASSARVYAAEHQWLPDVTPLRETDAYPAEPEDGYGWEKLFTERMCRHFSEDFGLATRVARYHNVYGPDGTFEGGREKAPAAICRKVALARLSGDHRVEIWGDGRQTRSFTYIDDCIYGTQLLTGSDVEEPLNIGSSELVTIDQLVDIVEEIAGIQVERSYRTDAPQGVRGRNSDNTLIQELLGWEPSVSLRKGLDQTFQWVHDRLAARL